MKKAKLLVITVCSILLLLGSANMAAQDLAPQWVKQFNAGYGDTGEKVTVDKDGNVYTVGGLGWTRGIFVQKQDKEGNVIWWFKINSSAGNTPDLGTNITLDNSGNVYIVGNFRGLEDFDPGPGTFYMESHPSNNYYHYDGFVLKVDNNGNFIWAGQFALVNPHHSYFAPLDVAVDSTGNVFIAGDYRGKVDFDPGPGEYLSDYSCRGAGYIEKLDMNGNFAWVHTYDGSLTCGGEGVHSIVVDSSDNIIVRGYNRDELDLDPGPGTYMAKDSYLMKMTNDGDFVWAYPGGGSEIVLDESDNIYSAGLAVVEKRSSDGNLLWSSIREGLGTQSIALDKSGNIYCTGYLKDTVDFDTGPGTLELTSDGVYDIFVMQLDNDGNLGWAVNMGGSNYASGRGITVDSSNNVFVTGHFTGTVDFDPGEETLNLTSHYGQDIFVMKMLGVTNEAPVAICQDIEIEADNNCEAYITAADVDAGSYDPDEGDEITLSLDNTGPFGIGTHYVELTVTDQDEASDSCFATVTVVDTTAPVPDLATLPTITGQCSAEITTYPTATDNCGGTITGTTTDPLTYTQQGTYTITWIYDDGNGNTAVQEQTVIVQDTTAPAITSISATPNSLWPANHKMVAVTVSVEAEDNCDASPVSKIIGVESNEPVDGLGDGDTSPDWEITGDLTLNLRAERSGKGTGRIYTITVECGDAVGNTTTASVTVVVPKNKKK
jgi:hypothetical protein